jgi:signal transduction histidine kinase
MIRTIFGKILAIVVAVLIISFAVTGAIMNAALHKMVTDEKSQQLQVVSDKVVNALDSLIKSNQSLNLVVFNNFIQALAANTDSVIWIVRDDGAIFLYSSIPESVEDKLGRSSDGFLTLPDKRQYESKLQKFISGDFFGLFKDTGVDWLTLNQPFELSQNGKFQGQVLIHTQVPTIYRLKYSILLIFIVSCIVGIAVALLFVTLLGRTTIKPLNQMKQAARKVASGEFTEAIEVKGKDEIAELAESFNNMVGALENSEKVRRDFIGNVSHELRTPITTIKGFVEGILDGVIPENRQKEYLTIVRDEIRRMQKLVNELLDMAKMQAGEVSLKLTDFDINELIRLSVISLQQMFIEKNLEFKADFETERMFVNADRDSIQRVIINLLHNAIKFTPENGEISIRTHIEKEKAVISVEDTGRGIAPEELPYIFDRFYKTDKSRSSDRAGVGLGLAIVRNIIVSHNETIRVESEEGHGTKFIFTLRSVTNV